MMTLNSPLDDCEQEITWCQSPTTDFQSRVLRFIEPIADNVQSLLSILQLPTITDDVGCAAKLLSAADALAERIEAALAAVSPNHVLLQKALFDLLLLVQQPTVIVVGHLQTALPDVYRVAPRWTRENDWADSMCSLVDSCGTADDIWQLLHSLELSCQRSLLPAISYWFKEHREFKVDDRVMPLIGMDRHSLKQRPAITRLMKCTEPRTVVEIFQKLQTRPYVQLIDRQLWNAVFVVLDWRLVPDEPIDCMLRFLFPAHYSPNADMLNLCCELFETDSLDTLNCVLRKTHRTRDQQRVQRALTRRRSGRFGG